MGKKKKKLKPRSVSAELNVMPFIDIFSMLNTFLLVSAAFVNLGILEVQVPFLTNSDELRAKKSKPKRELSLNISLSKDKIEMESKFTQAPIDETKKSYTVDDSEITKFHNDLVQLKIANPEASKVTFFSDDDVKYQMLVKVLDQIKFVKKTDPNIPAPKDPSIRVSKSELFPKIVIGNVIL